MKFIDHLEWSFISFNFFSKCKKFKPKCKINDFECFRRPNIISYRFVSIASNMTIPDQGVEVFNLRTTAWNKYQDIELNFIRVKAPLRVEKATNYIFYSQSNSRCCRSFIVEASQWTTTRIQWKLETIVSSWHQNKFVQE